MENPDLQGVFGIVPTPLKLDGEVDEKGLEHLIEHCAASRLHAAVVLGSNGEFPYLTFEEKVRVIRKAAAAGKGKIPIVAGVSAMSTRESMELSKVAREAGCQAVMAALCLYFQVDFESIKRHFEVLARQGGLPVIFYYFPETTNLVLSPEEIAEIAAIKGVHGAKITVFNRSFLKKVIKLTRTELWAVFAGTSFMMRDVLKARGAGVLCPVPLIAPKLCLDLYHALLKGQDREAQKLQDRLLAAVPLFTGIDAPPAVGVSLFKAMVRKPYAGVSERMTSGVAIVKEALRLQGHPITSMVRRPCPPLSSEQAEKVKAGMKGLGWI